MRLLLRAVSPELLLLANTTYGCRGRLGPKILLIPTGYIKMSVYDMSKILYVGPYTFMSIVCWYINSKTCVKRPLSKRSRMVFNANYRFMHVKNIAREHSAILSTFIKLPFGINIFILSIFEWPFYTGFLLQWFNILSWSLVVDFSYTEQNGLGLLAEYATKYQEEKERETEKEKEKAKEREKEKEKLEKTKKKRKTEGTLYQISV